MVTASNSIGSSVAQVPGAVFSNPISAFELTIETLVHPHATPEIVSHCQAAIDRLLEQFKGKPDLETLICIFADQVQEVEQALTDVRAYRSIETSLGDQLDQNGADYGEYREGEADDDYRRRLRAAAALTASIGAGDELLEILITLDNGYDPASIALVEHYPAGVILTAKVPIGGQLLGEMYGRFMKRAKAGGVRIVVLFEYTGAVHFVWSGETGSGWAEATSPGSTGGLWAEGV